MLRKADSAKIKKEIILLDNFKIAAGLTRRYYEIHEDARYW